MNAPLTKPSLAILLADFLETRIPPYLAVRDLQASVDIALLRFALKRSRGVQLEAARILGIGRITIANRLKKHGIDACGRDTPVKRRARRQHTNTQQTAHA